MCAVECIICTAASFEWHTHPGIGMLNRDFQTGCRPAATSAAYTAFIEGDMGHMPPKK